MAKTTDVIVPDIGDFKNIPIIEILVKPGDTVKADDALVTLESDKATMDVHRPPSAFRSGGEIVATVGDKAAMGSRILRLEQTGAGAAAAAAAPTPAAKSEPAKAAQNPPQLRAA